MKRNMIRTMDRLNIDEGVRFLIGKMWKHGYRTFFSCHGHDYFAYIVFDKKTGDGWFEENAPTFGFYEAPNHTCCVDGSYFQLGTDMNLVKIVPKLCDRCGAGINGYVVYRGRMQRG